MVPDGVPIGDWLHQGTSDPREVADRYDEWAQSYDDDLTSWSYQAPDGGGGDRRHPARRGIGSLGARRGLRHRTGRPSAAGTRIHRTAARARHLASVSRHRLGSSGAYDSLEQADLQQRLAFDDDSVDAVVCVGVMTYLPEVEAVWREFARVARPQGVVVVTQREDLWNTRSCQTVVDRLQGEGVWTPLKITGPAPYLPEGYGGTPQVGCYYLTAIVG